MYRFRPAIRLPAIRAAGGVAAAIGIAFVPAARADDTKRIAYGKHLSGECSTCHRVDGVDNGIPSITGWPTDDFVATVEFYRTGARPNPAMVSVAMSLDEDQIKALAAYYGTLPKPPKKSAQSR